MRTTKALLLAAAIGAAGVASSMAQTVYSVNVVGFVNLTLPSGFSLISNPLKATNDNINTIFPSLPDLSLMYRWDATNQIYIGPATYAGGAWDFTDWELRPGEGAWLYLDPSFAAPTNTVTFVGEVRQGNLATPVVGNFNLLGSQVPQAGGLTTTLGYTPADLDLVFQFDPGTQTYVGPFTGAGGDWDQQPVLKIGEGFFLFRDSSINPGSTSWSRNFNVTP